MQEYKFMHKGVPYVLIDTPGFDDTYKSNDEVVEEVIEWLTASYRGGMKLKGVIYLHRINEIRMLGSAFANLRMFRTLCGSGPLQHVVLATTWWDDIPYDQALEHEAELKSNPNFWKRMIDKGSRVVRLGQDRRGCMKLLEGFASNTSTTLQVQDETIRQGLHIHETAAMRKSSTLLQGEARARLQAEARRLQAGYEDSKRSFQKRLQEQDWEQQRRKEAERQKALRRIETLKKTVNQRVQREEAQNREQQLARDALKNKERQLQDKINERQRQLKSQETAFHEQRKREEYFNAYRCKREPSRRKTCDRCKVWIRDFYYRE